METTRSAVAVPARSGRGSGNVYTPACKAHDTAVHGQLAQGSSHVMAHVKALPPLPAAVGSYIRARLMR